MVIVGSQVVPAGKFRQEKFLTPHNFMWGSYFFIAYHPVLPPTLSQLKQRTNSSRESRAPNRRRVDLYVPRREKGRALGTTGSPRELSDSLARKRVQSEWNGIFRAVFTLFAHNLIELSTKLNWCFLSPFHWQDHFGWVHDLQALDAIFCTADYSMRPSRRRYVGLNIRP